MKHDSGRLAIIFIALCALVSCQNDTLLFEQDFDENQEKFVDVHSDLKPFFMSFESEGASRGWDIDLTALGIAGEFDEIDEGNVAGICSYGSHRPNQITIDRTFWQRANQLAREMIVFHELGHCYLERDHLEEAFANGYCQSIMRSGNCCCRDGYNSENRAYYLDELFSLDSR